MPIVRLPGGALRDEIREPLYDTIDLSAGAVTEGTRSFFQDIQGKDITQTNLRQSKSLETAVSFRIMGMAVDVHNFYGANERAMPLILEHSATRLKVGEKIYHETAMRFSAGRISSDVAGKVDAVFQQHGGSSVAAVILTGKHVVDINPLQSFQVDWILSGFSAAEQAIATLAADTKLRYVCSLKGLKRRPVQ